MGIRLRMRAKSFLRAVTRRSSKPEIDTSMDASNLSVTQEADPVQRQRSYSAPPRVQTTQSDPAQSEPVQQVTAEDLMHEENLARIRAEMRADSERANSPESLATKANSKHFELAQTSKSATVVLGEAAAANITVDFDGDGVDLGSLNSRACYRMLDNKEVFKEIGETKGEDAQMAIVKKARAHYRRENPDMTQAEARLNLVEKANQQDPTIRSSLDWRSESATSSELVDKQKVSRKAKTPKQDAPEQDAGPAAPVA